MAYSLRASSVVFPRNIFITQLCQLKSQFVQVQKKSFAVVFTFILTLSTNITIDCRSIMTPWHGVSHLSWHLSYRKCLQCHHKVCFSFFLFFKLAKLGTLSELRWQCDGCCVRPVSGLKTGGRKQSPSMNSRSKVSMVKTFLWTSTGKQAVDSHRMTVDNDNDSATGDTQLVFNWPFLPCLP